MNSSNLKPLYYLPPALFAFFFILNRYNFFPYYSAWDSSLLYASESLVINGGGMPGHLFHPDISVLWFEKFFIFPIAKFLKFISISTMQELQASSNPYLNMVDVVEFVRTVRLSYLYFTCCIFYVAFLKLLEDIIEKFSPWIKALIFSCIALFCFQYVTFPSNVIRYEFGAVLWGSISFLMMIYAVQTQQKRYIMLMGFFGGMAFLSKIVLLPSVILYTILYFVLNSHYQGFNLNTSEKERKQTMLLSSLFAGVVISSVIFIAIMVSLYLIKETTFIYGLELKYLMLTASPFLLAVIFMAISSYFIYKSKNKYNLASYYLHRLVLYMSFFYVPLLLQLFQRNGVSIFANAYIFSFALGQIVISITLGYNNSVNRIQGNFNSLSLTIQVIIAIIGILFLWYTATKKEKKQFLSIALGVNSLIFIFFLNKIFLRFGNETELGFYTLFITLTILLLLIYQKFQRKYIIIIPALMGIALQGYSLGDRIRLNNLQYMFNTEYYYFSPKEWSTYTYTSQYPETIKRVYMNLGNWAKSFYWTKNISHTKQLLRSISDNANQLQNSGIAFKGVLLPYYKEILEEVSPELASSLVLPLTNVAVCSTRIDYSFHLVAEERIPEDSMENLELTDLKFNNYFVYKITKSSNYRIDKSAKVKYVLINDYTFSSFKFDFIEDESFPKFDSKDFFPKRDKPSFMSRPEQKN